MKYREARFDELDYIAKLSTVSFGNYPFFDFVFLDLFKKQEDYFKYLEKLHRIHLKANMKEHKCFVGVESNRIVSVALLQEPNKTRINIIDYIKAGGISLVFPVGLFKILDFFKISEESCKDCFDKYPNAYYLEILAVDTSFKGKGLGSSMIKDCLTPYIKKQGGKDFTLITNTEINCKFYMKNGFKEFSYNTLERNGNKIDNWSFHYNI